MQSALVEYEVLNKMSIKEHIAMYWKFFFEKGEKVPDEPLPQKTVQFSELFDGSEKGLKASWLGHSSLLLHIDGHTVLTDPVFEKKVSPVGPTKFNRELLFDIKEFPPVDIVIISHDHYDHLNKFSIQKLSEKVGTFIVPLGVKQRLMKWGVVTEKIVELDWWQQSSPQNGLTITATPSRHFSGRGLFDRNKTLWASWVIQTDSHKVFFSGDTGYFDGFKEIGQKYGPFDITFLECGAYNVHWSNVHMFPEETVQAYFDLRGKVLQPIHWATFNLSLHPWYEPIERLTDEAFQRGAIVSTPVMGCIVNYEKPIVADFWWLPAMERSRKVRVQPEIASDLN